MESSHKAGSAPRRGFRSRQLALQTLTGVFQRRFQATTSLGALFRANHLSDADRGLVQELVNGCVRRKATLDAVIQAYANRSFKAIKEPVQNILRLGLYQLLVMERIPPHAAVSQSLALADSERQAAAKGFINAVLRQVAREMRVVDQAPDAAPRREIPCRPNRWCLLERDVLPSPAKLVEHLAAAYSYPDWLVTRWLNRYGEDEVRQLLMVGNEPAPVFLRPNLTRTTAAKLVAALRAEGVTASLSASGRSVRLDGGERITHLRAIRDGLCLVQDDAAAAVVENLNLQPAMSVLDLCAAPGGKTCQIAEIVGADGHVVAVDHRTTRMQRVEENARRLGLKNIERVVADATHLDAKLCDRQFDRVLVDVPCSNTGVLRKRVEARWRIRPADLEELPRLQLALARAGAKTLKPGGAMVYSTCSLEPEENEGTVRTLLRGEKGLKFEAQEQTLPQLDGADGAYWARLRKTS